MGYRGIRGEMTVQGKRIAYESTWERGFLTMLSIERDVLGIWGQPCRIDVAKPPRNGTSPYTPDFFVHWGGQRERGVIYEIKPVDMLRKHFSSLRPSFLEMRRKAREDGYEFKLVTDRHIGGWRLRNASFLRPYLLRTPAPVLEEAIAAIAATLCQDGSGTTVREILLALYRDERNRLDATPYVWRMVATRRIWADLDERMDQDSPMWLMAGEGYQWTDPYRSR